MKFYSSDNVEGHYIVNVDKMTCVVVHNNPWGHWLIPMNSNCVMDFFQKSGMQWNCEVGTWGALSVPTDWLIRVFRSYVVLDRPSARL